MFRSLVLVTLFVTCARADSPLAVKPKETFGIIGDLKKVTNLDIAPSGDELALFKDLEDGKLDQFTSVEAALIASGITDPDKRKSYVAKWQQLEGDVKSAIAQTKSPREQGDKLLKFLHAGPMKAGYESHQTSLADIFDSHKFNCVSSAVLYNLMSERLGLEARAVEIPGHGLSGHVFSVLRADGKLIDVETTNKLGFNPQGKRERPDGVEFDPKKNSGRREINLRQLIAVIYYNRGVMLAEKAQHHQSIDLFCRALNVDPASPSAAKNIVAEFTNWGPRLAKEGKFEEGLQVMAVGRKLAPNEFGLRNNYKVVWVDYAHARMKDGKVDDALGIAKRAALALPGRDTDISELPVRLFLKPGEELAKAEKWTEAMSLADQAMPKLEAESRKKMYEWRGNLYLRWGQAARKRGDWNEAFTALEKCIAADPKHRDAANNIAYYAQELIQETEQKAPTKTNEVVADLKKRFNNNKDVREVIANQARRAVSKASEAGDPAKALAALAERRSWIDDPTEVKKLGVIVYRKWAKSFERSDWKKSLEILATGMKEFASEDLVKHADAVCDAQGFDYLKAKEWSKAIVYYEEGLKYFPKSKFLQDRVALCRKNNK